MRVICFYFEKPKNLKNIAEIFYRYSPQIALSENSVFLEIDQCSLLYSEEKFLEIAHSIFESLEVMPGIGIATSVPLSFADAYLGTKDLKKIPVEFLKYFLFPFQRNEKQEALLTKTVWYLEKLGIRSLEDFMKIPARQLSSRFGALGLMLHARVWDSTLLLWPKFTPEEKIMERQDFDAEVELDSVEPVIFVLKRLLERTYLRLVARGKTLKAFEARFLLEKASSILDPHYSLLIELSFTRISIKTLLQLFRDKAQHAFQKKTLPGRVTGFEIFVTETEPYRPAQRDIFDPNREENEESYLDLVNRLSLKLGERNVFKAALKESYLPEKNWDRSKEGACLLSMDNLPQRPLRLLLKPLPIPIQNGKLSFRGHIMALQDAIQPEVVFSEWWEKAEERVYFKAHSQLGKCFWVFKNEDKYFLHGFFD